MLHTAGNLGREQLGYMSGPSLCWETRPELEGPPTVLSQPRPLHGTPMPAGKGTGRHRVAAGLWLQLTHIVCGPLPLSACDSGPSSWAERSPWRKLLTCLGCGGVPLTLPGEAWLSWVMVVSQDLLWSLVASSGQWGLGWIDSVTSKVHWNSAPQFKLGCDLGLLTLLLGASEYFSVFLYPF